MFLVLNKEKIKSYIVSVFTVGILLGIAFYMKNQPDLLQVNSANNNLPIYSVKTDNKDVALTMNCAWSQ